MNKTYDNNGSLKRDTVSGGVVRLVCSAVCVVLGGQDIAAQPVVVAINANMKHSVGGISTFDREKFITVHASITESDWDDGQQGAANFTNDLRAAFLSGYDVYFGRDTGYISYSLRNLTDQDPAKPGWARVSGSTFSIFNQGSSARSTYESKSYLFPYEFRDQSDIACAQFTTFWPDGTLTARGWALSTNDTVAEPFGSATGNFMGTFLNNYHGTAANSYFGRPLPKWVEVMNEPDWPLFEWPSDPAYGTSSPAELWKFHNSVANQIRSLNTNVMIGGYCPAFPDPEKNNFQEWTNEWVTFIDTCGTNMDFYTIHLYDIDDANKYLIRRGSFTEAVMDMIEHYSELKLGKPLPFVVSEYAGKDQVLGSQGWSALHDWKRMKSMSGYLMSFMDRPNLIGKTIPFIVLKAEWGRNPTTQIPYSARLMRQVNEPASYTGEWVYTEHVKLYELWRDVKGTRVDITSSDPDIQTDAYVNSNKAYVILNNLNQTARTVDLNLFEDHGNTVQTVREKNLYWNGTGVALDDTLHAGALAQAQLRSEGTAIMEYTFASPVSVDQTSDEVKYYATTYFQPINASQARIFAITNVSKGMYGEAILRLGMGRDRTLSKQPTVLFNGTPLSVPTDFMGHEGDDRSIFFGQLGIPVPYSLLESNNTISITYPDTGGYISSVALRACEFSKPRSVVVRAPVIASADLVDGQLVFTITNGTPSEFFDLLSATNVLTPMADWPTNQAGLQFDTNGVAMATNPIAAAREFFRLIERDPPPPPVTVIEFTAPDYSDGALNGQQNWNAEPGWTVGDAAGSGHIATAANSEAAVLNQAIQLSVGQTYSLSVKLQFSGTYATPTAFVYTFLGGLKDSNVGASVATGGTAADANIQIIQNTDDYRLLNNFSVISGASNLTGTQLNAGDILQFDYNLTLGVDADSTFYKVRLRNLTDGTDTGVGTVTGVDASIYNALTGTGAYGFFQPINPGTGGSGLSGVQVNSVDARVIP